MKYLIFFLCISLSFSCSKKPEIFFHSFGNTQTIKDGQDIMLRVADRGELKTIFINEKDAVFEIIKDCNVKDSFELYLAKEKGFKTDTIQAKVLGFVYQNIVKVLKDNPRILQSESETILAYFGHNPNQFQNYGDILYRKTKASNSGKKGVKNSIFKMELIIQLLSGKEIFSTYSSKQLFEFNKDMPEQVTEGLNLLTEVLEEGDEMIAIIPSHLGFKEKNVGNGIIPSNSPLLYKIKLISIIK